MSRAFFSTAERQGRVTLSTSHCFLKRMNSAFGWRVSEGRRRLEMEGVYLSHGTVGHEFHGERLLGCAVENADVLIGSTFAVEHRIGFASDEAWSC